MYTAPRYVKKGKHRSKRNFIVKAYIEVEWCVTFEVKRWVIKNWVFGF